jgi:hypothetical protein
MELILIFVPIPKPDLDYCVSYCLMTTNDGNLRKRADWMTVKFDWEFCCEHLRFFKAWCLSDWALTKNEGCCLTTSLKRCPHWRNRSSKKWFLISTLPRFRLNCRFLIFRPKHESHWLELQSFVSESWCCSLWYLVFSKLFAFLAHKVMNKNRCMPFEYSLV